MTEPAAPFSGIYLPHYPPRVADLDAVERALDTRFDVISIYQAWGSRYRDVQHAWLDEVVRRGRLPMITWEPWRLPGDRPHGARPEDQPRYRLSRILGGHFDGYVVEWARALAARPHEIWLRPMHEMNGSWYPWGATVNGNSPDEVVATWHHLREIFAGAGATNVTWVWSPHASSHPDVPSNAITRTFPGADHVDLIGLDAYNWCGLLEGARWLEPDRLLAAAIESVRSCSDAPIFVAETACPPDARRADWIAGAWSVVRSHALAGLVWFNCEKECDWRLEADQESAFAWRTARAAAASG